MKSKPKTHQKFWFPLLKRLSIIFYFLSSLFLSKPGIAETIKIGEINPLSGRLA
jgi:hypothetical protein